MLYAIRNETGRIVSLSETPQQGAEQVNLKDPEVLEFLSIESDGFSVDEFLVQSDTNAARILEDLIDVLIKKNQILFTDLPDMAQKKLLGRKLARNYNNPESEQTREFQSTFLSDDDTI